MKGLIIDEPWIGLILLGEKTWEMRKTACHHRGRIALIRKGSGRIVGTADVVDSLQSLNTAEAYAAAEPRHRIPLGRQELAFRDGWRTPWVLANAHALDPPVPYKHPSGAVIWVNLDYEVQMAVKAQGSFVVSSSKARRLQSTTLAQTVEAPSGIPFKSTEPTKGNSALPGTVRILTVTGGNIRNNHIYLPLDFFPQEAIGGSNRSETAARPITGTFSPGDIVETDIDRTKRILRARSAVGDFFKRAGVCQGDPLRLARTGNYSYEISKEANV
jgi:hypothetical protein